MAVKPLGGTPSTPDALLSAVLEQGGINASSPALFIFDNDKAGRNAYRKLCKTDPVLTPNQYKGQTFIWALRRTDEFRRFLKRNEISVDKSFFTAEFLFPIDEAAEICRDLIDRIERNESLMEWEEGISGDYWHNVAQASCKKLILAERGSPDWLYARGVPDLIKGNFLCEAEERSLDTTEIDRIAETALEYLGVS